MKTKKRKISSGKKKVITKSQNSQPSTQQQLPLALRTTYFDFNTFEKRAIPPSLIPQFCQDYLGYFLSPQRDEEKNGINVNEFYVKYGMPKSTFYDLIKEHELAKETHERVLTVIAIRRETGMVYKKMDNYSGAHMMRYYYPEWFEELKLRKELDKKEEEKPTTIIVNIPPLDAKKE